MLEANDVTGHIEKFNNQTLKYIDIVQSFRTIIQNSFRVTPESFNPTCNGRLSDDYIHSIDQNLVKPLEDFISNGEHANIITFLNSANDASLVCGRVFEIGETVYYCRQCAADDTSALCVDCFTNSSHRFHKYKMHTSGGGGCCDCGDVEAWTDSAFCNIHKVRNQSTNNNVSPELIERAKFIFAVVIEYASAVLTSQSYRLLPPYLQSDSILPDQNSEEDINDNFCTVIYNDEVHSFDQVINTLMRATKCPKKCAVLHTNDIHYEGRAVIKCGSFESCCKLKYDVEKFSSFHGSKPLKVCVVRSCMIAYQTLALRLLGWLQSLLKLSMKLREVFADVIINDCHACISIEKPSNTAQKSYAEKIFAHDISMWKSARLQFHHLFITGMLMDYANKRAFAIAFVDSYGTIMENFVKDDHEHPYSVAGLSVQIFTVPSLALYLIEEKNVLFRIMRTFLNECAILDKPLDKLKLGMMPYDKLRRVVCSLLDIKYLLTHVPDAFTEGIRVSFVNGFTKVLCLLANMQNMDSVTRLVDQHIEFELELKPAFFFQSQLAPVVGLILKWCAADKQLFCQVFRMLASKFYEEMKSAHPIAYKNVSVWNFTDQVISYDVSSLPVSIHLPLSRLLAGMSLYLEKFDVDCLDILGQKCDTEESSFFNSSIPQFPDLSWNNLLLIEFVVRARVLIAQVNSGLWRRNGISLLEVIDLYHDVEFCGEMLDRDIIILQLGASLINPHTYLISLLSKFSLINWTNHDFDQPPLQGSGEEERIQKTIHLFEEFLLLLITIISERYVPGVGKVTEADCLKHEIIQQLCVQSLTHSELEKKLPEHLNAKLSLEDVIGEVADFIKRPSKVQSKGIYVLKRELATTYNVFFYHYNREELWKSEEVQRKLNKTGIGLECCPPPKLPQFTKQFSKVTDLLTCDLMLQLMKTVLEKCLNSYRSCSEPLVHRMLHLIGIALLEEECGYLTESFTGKASLPTYDIRGLLEKLVSNHRVEGLKDLIKWTLRKFLSISQNEVENFTLEETAVESKEKKFRSRLAEERKAKIMAQLAAAQKNFMKDNAHLFPESTLASATREHGKQRKKRNDNVCLGMEAIVDQSPPECHTCILCQEQQVVTADGRALVYAAFVQQSTVLMKNRETFSSNSNWDLFISSNIGPGTHSSTCGHVMHLACWSNWYSDIIDKQLGRHPTLGRPNSFYVEKHEYLCPLCECLSNTLIPVLPKLSKIHENTPDMALKKLSFQEWKEFVITEIRNSNVQNDSVTVNCPTRSQKKITESRAPKAILLKVVSSDSSEQDDENASSFLSEDTRKVMLLYAQSTYTHLYSAIFHEHHAGVPLTAWQTCAYTIHAVDQYLRSCDKPLFGDLSSRQVHTLEALVRHSGAFGAAWKSSLVIKQQASKLMQMVLDVNSELPGIFDWDCFGTLVSLVCSYPSLFANSVSVVPPGSKQNFFLFQTMFYNMLVQALSSVDVYDYVSGELNFRSNTYCLCRYSTILHGTSSVDSDLLWNRIKLETLPFLRCSALFFYFLTDIPPPEELNIVGGATFENLCAYLGMPSSCNTLLESNDFLSIFNMWTTKLKTPMIQWHRNEELSKNMSDINSLIPLPEDYSELINRVSLFKCQKSDRSDSRYPTICLVCGETLCSQTYCCQVQLNQSLVGACYHHAVLCGGGVGIFLRIKDCRILLLRSPNQGCFATAPYVDEYGEPDPGLDRGNPLKLCPERYNQLKATWLTHSIYEEISRGIESAEIPLNLEWQHF